MHLAADLALKMTTVLAEEAGVETIGDPLTLRSRIQARILEKCHRAFRCDVFGVSPPIPLVLMREREVRALLAISELRARRASPAEARRVLEA